MLPTQRCILHPMSPILLQVQAYLWTEEQALFMEINNVDKW